jgi:cyanophycin synthetase
VARMASLCDGEVIFYGVDPAGAVLAGHVASGRRAVSIQDGVVVLVHGSVATPVIPVATEPVATAWGRLDGDGVLAAVAVGWALGLGTELMALGIRTAIDAPPTCPCGCAGDHPWK